MKEIAIEKLNPMTFLERDLVARLKRGEQEKVELEKEIKRLATHNAEKKKVRAADEALTIKRFVRKAHTSARARGFWPECDWLAYMGPSEIKTVENAFICQMLLLIVSEIAEATEEMRQGNRKQFEVELADTWIRLADLCGGLGIDIEPVIKEKMEYNETRPVRHGKRF